MNFKNGISEKPKSSWINKIKPFKKFSNSLPFKIKDFKVEKIGTSGVLKKGLDKINFCRINPIKIPINNSLGKLNFILFLNWV